MSQWSPEHGSLDFATLRHLLRTRRLTLHDLVTTLLQRQRTSPHPHVWLSLHDPPTLLARARHLDELSRSREVANLPLLGLPFAVKDNIDVAGLPTTAACPAFSYTPQKSATVVQRLEAAGAICIGKTNLDQFATGLTGVLSPYGSPRNPFNTEYISGGSSSGSAVAVAAGLVSFALGTDTAGSGRVPAAFNNLVGLKPTRGVVSTTGVLPACRSLDCVSFLTLNINDAAELLAIAKAFDPADPYSRRESDTLDLSLLQLPIGSFRFGVPRKSQLEFHGDTDAERLYDRALTRLESLGGSRIEIDAAPFLDTGKLLYEGPWVAERLAAITSFYTEHKSEIHPVTQTILERATRATAVDAFSAQYRLQSLKRAAESQWSLMDVLILPTAPTILKHTDVMQDPVAASAKLGRYTNFVNLLDLSALALPAGFRTDGLPFGITAIAPAFAESNLLTLGSRFAPSQCGGLSGSKFPPPNSDEPLPTSNPSQKRTLLCVVGAHLSGQPLNHQLTELDAVLVRRTRTAPLYRLYALPNTTPPKPGLARIANGAQGAQIELEVWSLPESAVGKFLGWVAPPLCIGNIVLENGELVKGFLCEPFALPDAKDISHFTSWPRYRESLEKP